MKVTAKPLKGDPFDVEVQPEETVEALKAKIAAVKPDLPAELQKIVHEGKVLADASTLQECGVTDGNFVVIMLSKAKPAAPAAPAAPVAASSGSTGDSHGSAAPVAPVAPGMESTVQMLCDMGFPRDMVQQCLRAAFNNPDRAVEYLMSGIPPNLQQMASGAPPPAPPAQQPMFPPMSALPAGNAPSATGPLAQLANHPRFNQLRQAVQQQPQSLNQVMTLIAQADPNLIPLIAEHQDEFVRLLSQPMSGGPPGAADPVAAMLAAAQAASSASQSQGGAAPAPPPQAPPAPPPAPPAPAPLTAEEQQAVGRLTEFGFTREQAMEAYLACDRNEETAASFLFDSMDAQ
ncbi:unnamed protein product [Polarella glacialis]|uniref:UV excision repair protein RAD23 n=2 Tax=Polarella glacialis TaxID=89957 RepID=A0A813DHN9_POLGL|nr:unnamed protein product [Polarella glacialis]|mmetsp:Transcript_5441/g.10209  ORF Transcript_5441/g.10209 Transcript_5441/m.10209 type:complete len:347 (+) Transcript_5441:101-1141(+)